MLFIVSFLLSLLQASDLQELPPKLYNDWWSVQITNDTPYPLRIEPDDVSYRYLKDGNRQPVYWNIFDIKFPGYEVELSGEGFSLQFLCDIASLTLTGESCEDLSLKILYLNQTEQVLQVRLRAVSS